MTLQELRQGLNDFIQGGPGNLSGSSAPPLDLASNMSRATAKELVGLLADGLPTTSDEVSRRLDCANDGPCSVCQDLFKVLQILGNELDPDDNEFGEVSL